MKETIFLLLLGLSFAVPACPSYPYHDYVAATSYQTPQKPVDTLLQYCNFNLNPICVLTNVLNTTEDKKAFIAESIANNSFDNLLNWNQNIRFGKWFNTTKSSKNIKDAWISIAYFTPSVYDNGTYLLANSSRSFTKSNFTFVVDTRKLSGDCKDNFRICGYSYSITMQNTSSIMTATMNVKSEYMVDRYHLVTHCGLFGCWVSCDYYRTDSFKDSLIVSDSKKINITKFNPTSNYSVVDYYNGLAEVLINANDSKVHFQIGNSTFDKINYLYKIRYELQPYNVLVKELVPANKTSAYGLSILDRNGSLFRTLAPYSDNCSLIISDHFYSRTISGCSIPNVSHSKPEQVPVTTPKIFDLWFYLILSAIALYAIYQIVKKVIPHA